MFEQYPFLLDLFSFTKQDVIDYSNKQTPVDTNSYQEALYFLSKNSIPVPEQKFKLNVSVKFRNIEGYYDRLSPGNEQIYDVWIYGNGVFASMLEIN